MTASDLDSSILSSLSESSTSKLSKSFNSSSKSKLKQTQSVWNTIYVRKNKKKSTDQPLVLPEINLTDPMKTVIDPMVTAIEAGMKSKREEERVLPIVEQEKIPCLLTSEPQVDMARKIKVIQIKLSSMILLAAFNEFQ